MANQVILEFAGDATKLAKAAKEANRATQTVSDGVSDASDQMRRGAKEGDDYSRSLGDIGSATTGALDGLDAMSGGLQAVVDIQQYSIEKAARLARANNDVRQATEDYAQALRDTEQAAIDTAQAGVDLEQARLDEKVAMEDYNAAVREFGANSNEAKQAQLDLKQAGIDVKQATEDNAQALRDASQASIDAEAATLDLAEAQREANPPDLQAWADQIGMITPLISAIVGVVGLATAAQWAWNAAQLASPLTWLVIAIGAVIAVIVLIAAKTDWFQRAWKNSWKWIKETAASARDFLKRAGSAIADAFTKPARVIASAFRAAFNSVASAWNSTVGRLSWTVPGWVPGIGGNSISVPHIPRFHTGTRSVPGAPGQETLAILQGGETVSTRAQSQGGFVEIKGGDAVMDALIKMIADRVSSKGGRATSLGVRFA
jgi:hypothetical protein